MIPQYFFFRMSNQYRDYIISDKGLFCTPSATPVFSVKLWQEIVNLVQQDNPPKKVARFLAQNEGFKEQVLQVDPYIQQLEKRPFQDRWSKQHEMWYKGFGGSFSSNLHNEMVKSSNEMFDTTLSHEKDWQTTLWCRIQEVSPDLVKIIKKLYPLTKRGAYTTPSLYDPNQSYHWEAYDTRNINQSVRLSVLLEDGTFQKRSSDHLSQADTQRQGCSVCVFLNKEAKFYTGSGLSQSIAGAKMYESLEAAKRSCKLKFPQSTELTYIKVQVSFEEIIDATTTPALEMKRVQSLKEKEEITLALDLPHKTHSPIKKM